MNLNGLWDYAITDKESAQPEKWDGKILVPFCVESSLSGVGREVGENKALWYRLKTDKLTDRPGQAWMLHFGAVDWQATVWVNGLEVARHEGGFDGFSASVSRALKDGGPQEIVVRVWDPTNSSYIPRGKQVKKPGGIFYTSVTGIWQTVWAEPVFLQQAITRLSVTPDLATGELTIRGHGTSAMGDGTAKDQVTVLLDGKVVAQADGELMRGVKLQVKEPKPWSPESPVLYDIKLKTAVGEELTSYCAFREIKVAKDSAGVNRLFLNGKPYFQFGPLDQGWWPDGLYTAPTDEALKYDIEMTKRWGMNMLRKHVKVEPARFYYHCDKLGMLVWQDMPSGERSIKADAKEDLQRSPESAACYEREWKEIMDEFRFFPCIVMWVPFNEGWGQFDTKRITEWTKSYDPTRLVNNASGWTDRNCGDVIDMHNYPGPNMLPVEKERASVLGEFGGLGLPVPGHTWVESDKNWGYRTFKTKEELIPAYEQLLVRLRPLIGKGLSAAVYTQTTDVEVEVNGLMTYDRRQVKIPFSTAALAKNLYGPIPIVDTLIENSINEPQTWRYTLETPAEGWQGTAFDAATWKEGPGGFGNPTTPGSKVRTEWKTENLWLRRTFELTKIPANLTLSIHHDEDTEIYLNGTQVARLTGWTTDYSEIPLPAEAIQALKVGKNTLAVHTRQKTGGQYIDVGLMEVREQK